MQDQIKVVPYRLSADGSTLAVGAPSTGGGNGAVNIFTRSGTSAWTQQALISSPSSGASFGQSVSLSGDGNTLAIGGPATTDGTTWVYTRSGSSWSQQASLTGAPSASGQQQGYSVALSADGNTLTVGGPGYSTNGGTWIFVRSGSSWSQQGPSNNTLPLVGTGATGNAQGSSVALSADGNILAIGGPSNNGAVWIFTRSGNTSAAPNNFTWTQQAGPLTHSVGSGEEGFSVALSADGKTLAVGATQVGNYGVTYIWVNNTGSWITQATLIGSNAVGTLGGQGYSVSLSSDGNFLAVGDPQDNSTFGATWIFARLNSIWSQIGSKLVVTGNLGIPFQGTSVSLSADGNTLAIGANSDSTGTGATWIFV